MKWKSEVSAVSAIMDSIFCDLWKVLEVVSDSGEVREGQSEMDKEMEMLQFLPPDCDHRKIIMDRMIRWLQVRVDS